MRTFILLSAVPGAGKSTWAKAYASQHENVFIVSSDEVRKEVTGEYQNFTQEPMVWEVFRQRIHEYGAKGLDVTVIADAVNDTNILRCYYAKEAAEFDYKIFVFIHKELEVVLKQNMMRRKEKWVPPDIIEIFYQKIEQPSEDAIVSYDKFIYIK